MVVGYLLPVMVGGGLVIGLAARRVFAAPDVGRWVFLGALLAGGGPLVRSDASWPAAGTLRRGHRRDARDRHGPCPRAILRRRRHRLDAVGR